MRIGVLALQGDFLEHEVVLGRLGVETRQVRLPADLDGLDGLVIPGGESTTMTRLARDFDLVEPLQQLVRDGLPVFGTCAGMILLAREVDGRPGLLGGLDVSVRRNAFGRQVESFEIDLPVPELGEDPVRAVFIRAPVVERVGPGVRVLARLPDERVVAVQQGRVIGAAFHPELTPDDRFHRYFVRLAEEST
ncbi:MAG TPA: pyridoxal 5'-phosphate synthase glutaminase subunit PdxT [Chloroflexota bacterium]